MPNEVVYYEEILEFEELPILESERPFRRNSSSEDESESVTEHEESGMEEEGTDMNEEDSIKKDQ